jgi:CDP-2,3-bis-(O-geranylgeranyl)-sn-glycerol synthase
VHPFLVLQLLALLLLANGTPVIVTRLLGRRFAAPVDCGSRWLDGRPLLGSSKTLRGLLASVLVTSACAPLAGLHWTVGAVVSATAMTGDLCSSFVKRRLGLPPGGRATGLDQIPESFLPLLASARMLPLTGPDMVMGVALFFVSEVLLSRLLYRLHIRQRPY